MTSKAWARSVKAGALIIALTAPLSARQAGAVDIGAVLQRAGERVTEYLARAQSIMCLEKVAMQPLNVGFSAEGPARVVESELRLSWHPTPENPIPTEAKTLRQVLKVNGSPPRKKDWNNCTTPEQNDVEEQPLSILLPQQRENHTFTFDRRETLDGREAVVVAYREIRKPAVDASLGDEDENCVSFGIDGGMLGRIWIDVETHDVLRLDRSLIGLVDIPLPRKAIRGGTAYWTVERLDSSIKFKRVAFQDPEESIVLPASASKLQVIRGGGSARLRTSTQYLSYRRFITGARVIPPQ